LPTLTNGYLSIVNMKTNIVSKFCSTMDNNITVCRDTKEKISLSLKKEQWLYLKAGGDNINLDIVII
jgi:hypothetical protein